MNKLGRKLNENEAKDPQNSIEYWRNQIEKHGVVYVQKRVDSSVLVGDVWLLFAKDAVDEYEKNELEQKDKTEARGEERAEKALKLAEDANRISRKANLHGLLAIGISIVAVFVTVLLALANKQA